MAKTAGGALSNAGRAAAPASVALPLGSNSERFVASSARLGIGNGATAVPAVVPAARGVNRTAPEEATASVWLCEEANRILGVSGSCSRISRTPFCSWLPSGVSDLASSACSGSSGVTGTVVGAAVSTGIAGDASFVFTAEATGAATEGVANEAAVGAAASGEKAFSVFSCSARALSEIFGAGALMAGGA